MPSSYHLIDTVSGPKVGVLDLGGGLEPVQPLGLLAPELRPET